LDGQDGLQSFRDLCRQHGGFDTLGTRTSSEGSHLYFRWPSNGHVVRNSAKKIGRGIDIRGEGGYVIVPPSHHPSGAAYVWLGDREFQPIIDAPRWLLALVEGHSAAAVGSQQPEKVPFWNLNRKSIPSENGKFLNLLLRLGL
jgi:bifunctional DNA primase/polymerase-like protein